VVRAGGRKESASGNCPLSAVSRLFERYNLTLIMVLKYLFFYFYFSSFQKDGEKEEMTILT